VDRAAAEGTKFRIQIVVELKTRGVTDNFIKYKDNSRGQKDIRPNHPMSPIA
jgi:hypothetical protein